MSAVLQWLMKILPPKTVIDAIFSFLKWLASKTSTPLDDVIIARLEELKDFIYSLLVEEKRKRR